MSNTHPEREAIEGLIPQLRPFTLSGDCKFVLSDGTKLELVGISQPNFLGGTRDGEVAVLQRSSSESKFNLSAPVSCVGVVVLRPETDAERRKRSLPEGYAATFMVQGLAHECLDETGHSVLFPVPDAVAVFPLLITCR
ncbi:MAG: hypothetical protein V1738_05310 [Patescibacteria group bacterium]